MADWAVKAVVTTPWNPVANVWVCIIADPLYTTILTEWDDVAGGGVGAETSNSIV